MPDMSPAFRAASTATIAAFFSAFVVGALIYGFIFVPYISILRATVIALSMSLVASVTVFATVWVLVQVRYPRKRPVIGAMRGAVVGVCVLIFVTTGHALLTAGSGGVLYSVFGQLFHALWALGWFAATIGGLCGKHIERIFFGNGGN